MSAWAEIVYADNSDRWRGMCARALAEVQAEQRRKDAAKIRADTKHIPYGSATDYANRHADLIDGLEHGANLIDPEVSDAS